MLGGNLVKQMTLACHHCGYAAPEDAVAEVYKLHTEVEHPEAQGRVTLDLVPKCVCGHLMVSIHARPADGGAGVKTYFECRNCEQTGWVKSGDIR